MKYKALIFDFNGVLWWDTELQEEAWQQTAIALRGTPLTDDELRVQLHGRTNKHTLEYITGKTIDSLEELERLTQFKEENYRQKCLKLGKDFKLSPGAIELLDYLEDRNVPINIATASEITNVKFFFEHLGLANWFELDKVILDDGSRPGKPAPDIYLAAAKLLNTVPQECVVVEDSKSGMAAAYNAKIGYLIALGPEVKHRELYAVAGVQHVIVKLNEIIELNLFNS